jgi:hypothetical protein
MQNVTVSLITNKPNELNRFLSTYYNKEMGLEKTAFKWSCIYKKPLESVDLISTLVDNIEKFEIEVLICMDPTVSIRLSNSNINQIIKYMYNRYS